MFGWLKRKKRRRDKRFEDIRELLFGDVPLEVWAAGAPAGEPAEPWTSFEAARDAVDRDDPAAAVAALQRVIGSPDLESRQYLQAWHHLRSLGRQPEPEQAKQVLGVVLEVNLEAGLDTLAAYADHSARYINHAGKLIVWDAPEREMSLRIDALLEVADVVVAALEPSDEPRRRALPRLHARLNMLTPSGIHFGEGPFEMLAADRMGGPLITVGTRLMQALIEKAEQADPPAPAAPPA